MAGAPGYLLLLLLPAAAAIPPDVRETPLELPWPPLPEGLSYAHNATLSTAGEVDARCLTLTGAGVPLEEAPWFCRCAGCGGNPGAKGDRGDRGPPGRPGGPGRRGAAGFPGPPGFVGRPGIKGQKGDEGAKGWQGVQGSVGPKGERGLKGEKGERGLEGFPGEPGPKGDQGVCPQECHAARGAPGAAGPPGPRGAPGATGPPGPEGPKGDTGEAGRPGPPGTAGAKGESGPRGECECADGRAGPKGDQGPPGESGARGDKGDAGFPGLPGPCVPGARSAFAAQLASSYPPPGSPVVFATLLYNVQGGYRPASGMYAAPVNGTYVFSYHLTVHRRVLKVGLFRNFLPVVKTTEPDSLASASHSVVLRLVRGDRVWIQVKDELSNGMYAGPEGASTFSGFLLYPDTCEPAFLRSPMPDLIPPETGFDWG